MIIGLGNDIIDIRRVERTIERYGERFLSRIFTEIERRKSDNRAGRAASYAKRFAAKEACAKALGTGIRNGLAFNQFEVYNDELGKPKLRLWGEAKSLAERLGVSSIHVTLADERHYACATVIIES